MALYKKDMYHSDLKLVNTIICQDEKENFFLKLIDMGGATFDHSYLIAITPQYFPPMDTYTPTDSKEKRYYTKNNKNF